MKFDPFNCAVQLNHLCRASACGVVSLLVKPMLVATLLVNLSISWARQKKKAQLVRVEMIPPKTVPQGEFDLFFWPGSIAWADHAHGLQSEVF